MFDVFIMDLGGNDANVQTLTQRFPHARVVRYYDNHLDTLKRCISRCRTPFAWVISSVCDYTDFDFDYRAKPWEAYQLHCWASGDQQFGDTFLVNVSEFSQQLDIELLEWYKDINWHSPGVPRLPVPVVTYTSDNLIEVVKTTHFHSPYVLFKHQSSDAGIVEPNLWRNRAVHTLNKSNSVSLIPREIFSYLETQIYDYPYVIKQNLPNLGIKPLDIIFLSYNEQAAETNYQHLLSTANRPIKRVNNVKGRVAAYHAAAELSTTDWFFLVPAKLKVAESFDWSWQPDYLQEPKHYIFHAENPINGLQYGHMAVIAYNKNLVFDTDDSKLDFAMSQLHTVVPVLSGLAQYNTDPLIVWRTAFREVIKLLDDVNKQNSVESTYRLQTWLTIAQGNYSEWSIRGASDAVEYYKTISGNYSDLMLTFDWSWLQDFYNTKYSMN